MSTVGLSYDVDARGVARCHHGALILGAACALICALFPSPASASIAPPDYYGANIQPLIKLPLVPPSGWNGFIADMGRNSLNTARIDALWSWAEPKAPVNGQHTYVWNSPTDPRNSLDQLVGTLASNGVRMLAVLSTPPAWAVGGGRQLAPTRYADFVAFAAAFAARYGVGGSFWQQNPLLPNLPVEQFEVWTEANSSNFWAGTPDPAEYLKVFEPLSAAVHAADPSAQVLASIGWENFQSYVSQLFQLGMKGSADGIGFHPYAPDAPGVLLLTEQLRSTLAAAGHPNLPIYLTEIGQPAVPSGPGASHAYAGLVSDSARAATLSLSGDALAHSDCGVQSFDVYALIGSGTNLEPGGEGYMGLLNLTTGVPNATGAAIIAGSQRWQAAPAAGLVLCSRGTTPAGALLPLGVTVTHTGPTCVSAVVTYFGNPIEGAELVLRTADGRVDPAGTNAFGQAQMCLQDGPAIKSFAAYAELSSPLSAAALTAPNVARSAAYTCPVTSAPCTTGSVVAPPAAGSAGTGVVSRRCGLSAAILSVTSTRTRLHARLACKGGKQPAANLRVWLERRDRRKRKLVISLALSKAHWRTFAVADRLYVGDRIIMTVAASKAIGLPSVMETLTATKKLVRRAATQATRRHA